MAGGDLSREVVARFLVARTTQQSRRLKKRFLEVFAEYGNITTAATTVGMSRANVYWWQEHDEAFSAAFKQADIQATETLEAEARRRAVEGVTTETPIYAHGHHVDTAVETKYSDTLLIFLLKARAPDKYRERVQVQHADAEGGRLDLATLMQRAREYRDAEQRVD